MSLDERQGIALASGFILNAPSLLDMRECNETIDEFQGIISGGAGSAGLTSFIKSDNGFYVYTGSDFINLRATMKGSTETEDGSSGLVPAPSSEDYGKFLNSDGTWKKINLEEASDSTSGLMSVEDKEKLDSIESGANFYTHPSYTPHASGLYKITVDETGHVSQTTAVTKQDILDLGVADGDQIYPEFIGASSSSDGSKGLVPAPSKGEESYFLRGDGTWSAPSGNISIDPSWGKETTDIPEIS